MNSPHLLRFPDAPSLFAAAAGRVFSLAREAQERAGVFHLALAGGSTPRGLYRLLAQAAEAIDWRRVRFYFGDERTVPPDHPDSNFRMAREALFEPLGITPDQICRMEGESDPQEAADRYEEALRRELGDRGRFDLVLLGMGDDGHTASLFPQTSALEERQRRVSANPVPVHHTTRLTLTYPALNAAREVLFLVTGAGKAPALRAVLEGPPDVVHYPSQGVQPTDGRLVWMVDEAAAARLSRA